MATIRCRPRHQAGAGLCCLALVAFASQAAAQAANMSITVPYLIRTHLQQAGLVPSTASEAQMAAAVQTYTSLLQQLVDTNRPAQAGSSTQTYSALAGLTGQGVKALAASLDQQFCSTGACPTATAASNCSQPGGRKLLADGGKKRGRSLLSPVATDYAELTVYAAAALMLGDNEAASQVIKYSGIDPMWASCVIDHIGAQIVYRPAPNVNSSYVYPLKSASGSSNAVKIAIMGDWGSGQPQALNMLSQIISGFNPDMVMHLGDVYYSGTKDQQSTNQYEPVRQYLKAGMQYWTIPGNHDYYAGGQGFLDTIDQLRRDGVTQQESSFFVLEGAQWVFIGLDTGVTDTEPLDVNTDMPYLEDNQLQWALDKINKAKAAGKRVVLCSHHQFFTAAETVGTINGTWPAVNAKLQSQLSSVLASVDVWFWGHEHTFEPFQPYAGLQRGRMIGNSAIPMLQASQPYAFNSKLTAPPGVNGLPQAVAGSPQSALSSFGYYLQHAFAILTLQGGSAQVDYYQLDWNCWLTRGCDWYAPQLMWSESF